MHTSAYLALLLIVLLHRRSRCVVHIQPPPNDLYMGIA